MPGMDGTGPFCLGEKTGKCLGLRRNSLHYSGCGRGWGFGRSCSDFSSDSVEYLSKYAGLLENRLSEIKQHISNIKQF